MVKEQKTIKAEITKNEEWSASTQEIYIFIIQKWNKKCSAGSWDISLTLTKQNIFV